MIDYTQHEIVISDFLHSLNAQTSDFILKGGTALRQCYGLDRISEDIDFNSAFPELEKYVAAFCEKNGYGYHTKKNTNTVKRYMLNYARPKQDDRLLKIKLSLRSPAPEKTQLANINGIETYNINTLARMKAQAYSARDKLRDLYDVSFICTHFYNELNGDSLLSISDAVSYKGVGQFDYLMKTQKDNLIDEDKMETYYLTMIEKLNLSDKPAKIKIQAPQRGNEIER